MKMRYIMQCWGWANRGKPAHRCCQSWFSVQTRSTCVLWMKPNKSQSAALGIFHGKLQIDSAFFVSSSFAVSAHIADSNMLSRKCLWSRSRFWIEISFFCVSEFPIKSFYSGSHNKALAAVWAATNCPCLKYFQHFVWGILPTFILPT